jgi:hypothetical protein
MTNKQKQKGIEKMESITIKKTWKNVWMIKFDDYEKSFKRTSEKRALEIIRNARERNEVFADANENSQHTELWGIWN